MKPSGLNPETGDSKGALMTETSSIHTSLWLVTTFYKFTRLNNLDQLQASLENKAKDLNIKGLVILGPDGINSTISATSDENLKLFKQFITESFGNMMFKDSQANKAPFRRFKVKQRDEIVTIGAPELFPEKIKNHHLTPTEWNQVLKHETDYVLVDTRNWYETKIGTFKGAQDPKTDQFSEFPKWMEQQNHPKDKKMLIFCTGGIRCEKGILELQKQGYNNVYQLEGGILKYLEEYPNDQFEGECFVFDNRVAVDQNLQPTQQYKLCPHCGQPAFIKIDCARCDYHAVICDDCSQLEFKKDTCSKNCAYWWERHPGQKGSHQILDFENNATQPSSPQSLQSFVFKTSKNSAADSVTHPKA